MVFLFGRLYNEKYSHKLIPEDHVVDCNCYFCYFEKDNIKEHNNELEQIKKILSTREHVERK